MSTEEEIKAENLRELLRQYWNHYRHIETERYWFMSVYAAVVGVLLGIIFKTDLTTDKINDIWLLVFLIVLTIIGFFINVRWMQTLVILSKKTKEIATMLVPEEETQFEAPSKGIWKVLRTRYLFLSFYVIVFFGLFSLVFTR